ncbi:enoyl-[acyl-carrier-protein] reductase, mitochondrial [Aphomia sociella]
MTSQLYLKNIETRWRKSGDWKARYSKLYSSRRISMPKGKEPRRISFMTNDCSPYASLLMRIRTNRQGSSCSSEVASPRYVTSLLSHRSEMYNSRSISDTIPSDSLGGNETLLLEMVQRSRELQDEAQDQTLELPNNEVSDDQSSEACVHGLSMHMTECSVSRSRMSRISTRRDMDIPSILAFNATTSPAPVGKNLCLPRLPSVGGDEGVGEVVEIGSHVCTVDNGDRVVLTSRLLGTWRYYGIYHERDIHIVSPNLPLPEAAMLTIAPCTAYRMLKDFIKLKPGDTVIQNAANSPCGQCIIQFCKIWGINTFNIVANHCGYEAVREHLLSLGATTVCTLEEAEELFGFDTSLSRPILALNCLSGRYENVMLKLLERNGTIVYYGCAFDLPLVKQFLRCDATFARFHLNDWDAQATCVEKDIMMKNIVQSMVIGKFKAPLYEPVELKNYVYAIRNTVPCEAFATVNYIFDFTLP